MAGLPYYKHSPPDYKHSPPAFGTQQLHFVCLTKDSSECALCRYPLGEIVHHEITNEEGRIVRIVKLDGQIAYVVEVASKATGKNIEALWWTRELSELREVE